MASESPLKPKPSFSPWRKWRIGLNVSLIVLVVFCVVVMVNYLSRDYSTRFHLSSGGKTGLSRQTTRFLQSFTNNVKVTVYYDREEPFYSTVLSLLNEYKAANTRIAIETVDYVRDAGLAQQIKAKYNLTFPSATNLVIFDCEGRKPFVVDGNMLTRYTMEEVPNETDREYRKKPVEFNGERLFTGALLTVTSTNQLSAYFLEGHGEHPFTSGDETYGYSEFAAIVAQNRVIPRPLRLEGTNAIPLDGLLIIAGPRYPFHETALQKIDEYLNQGGRLLVLFNLYTTNKEIGLEKLLAKWGVDVGPSTIKDPDQTYSGADIIVTLTNKSHALVNPLITLQLQMVEPRSVGKLKRQNAPADGLQVDEVAFSGPRAFPTGDLPNKKRYPLIAAVEKGGMKGVLSERGETRIVVSGDSLFLINRQIGGGANRAFASCAINWLLSRTQFLDIGPQQVLEHRVVMTARQLQNAEWILVAGMPGAVLLFGGLVWFRRRK